MSLVPDYDTSDSSEFEEEEQNALSNSNLANGPADINTKSFDKLPAPNFIHTACKGQSVFANPFVEAENAKTAVLEKHVKMVNRIDNVDTINGKKICWNYRKGKCRFGHKCKYAHDSELQKSREQLKVENQIQQTIIYQNKEAPQAPCKEIKLIQNNFKNKEKRKRPGLAQGLVPSKKVLKSYFKNK